MARGSLFDALPNDLVLTVLARTDADARIKVLPLVCHRFAELLRRAGDCWRRLAFKSRRWGVPEEEEERLRLFLSWAIPRAGGLQDLRCDLATTSPSPSLEQLMQDLLCSAFANLRRLELKSAFPLRLRGILPAHVQRCMERLFELDLLSEEGIFDLKLAGLTCLERLNLVDDSEMPASLDAESTLPPSLTWLGLTPVSVIDPPDGGQPISQVPACVLGLPALRFLDVSESTALTGLDTALPHLTGLTGLALDHASLPSLPPQLSLLTSLRLLSLHGVLDPTLEEPPDFSPLASLKEMRVLSISECRTLTALPPALAGLTNLKAFHVEKCPTLRALPEGISLPRCQMMSIDWPVLLSSHHLLPRLPALKQLLLGMMWYNEEGMPVQSTAMPEAKVLASSLAACPSLELVTTLIYPESPLHVGIAGLMLEVPRHCPPRVRFRALSANEFFLTDAESLAQQD